MDYKAGMFIYSLAFLLGVLLVQQFSVLPDTATLRIILWLLIFCIVVFVRLIVKKVIVYRSLTTLSITLILLLLIGLVYSLLFAEQRLSQRLNEAIAGRNIIVEGRVSSIPVSRGSVQSFEFIIDDFYLPDDPDKKLLSEDRLSEHGRAGLYSRHQSPEKLKLNWYYGLPVNADEQWQLVVRLKPPHGFLNPGGFDYEAWLFQHGIDAVGYVRKSSLNRRMETFNGSAASSIKRVNRVRQSLSEKIDALVANEQSPQDESTLSLVKALAVGDKSSITDQQWRVLANTGTSHLMAISGLHIGLAMLFAYMLIRFSLPVSVMNRMPAQHIAITGGCVVAFFYALIAGFSIPTQRAIIMLLVLSVMMLIRRNHRPMDALGLAIFLVLLFDPLAVLSVGFWFSFSAVAVIFISIKTKENQQDAGHGAGHEVGFVLGSFKRVLSILREWVRLQLLISIFLLPLSLFMFQQGSLVSPLANLLLIPYVSFLVVPVVLLATICSFLSPSVSAFLYELASALLDFIWPFLSVLSELPFALWVQGDVGIADLLLASLAIAIIYYSKYLGGLIAKVCRKGASHAYPLRLPYTWRLRAAALLLCLPVIFMTNQDDLKSGEYQVAVLDVGQGFASVLQTSNHVLVFDSGAKFSEKLDAGKSVVIPYLRFNRVKSIDRLIISHGDADHIGGAQAILDEFPDTHVVGQDVENLKTGLNIGQNTGQNIDQITGLKTECLAGQHWHWDGVDFSILSPEAGGALLDEGERRNNHSCVLRVSSPAGSMLFTGDIEKKAEKYLLDRFAGQLNSDILMVPHHGSNTSSGSTFIDSVKPKLAIISAGYRNRYKLPGDKVVIRYERANIDLMNTANSGAIMIKMQIDDSFSVSRYRQTAQKYWHHVFD